MAEEEKDEGGKFKVVDRRHFDAEGNVRPEPEEGEEHREEDEKRTGEPAPAEAPETRPPPPSPAPEKEEEERAGYHVGESPDGYGQLDFAQFVLGVAQLAFAFLGDLPNPQTGRRERNVAAAKQQIDLLLLLRDKTQGNLTDQEDNLLGSIVYDLQLRFVEVVQGQGPGGGEAG